MSISNREQVKQAFPNKTWIDKVSKMSDQQVTAIFLRLRRQGKI